MQPTESAESNVEPSFERPRRTRAASPEILLRKQSLAGAPKAEADESVPANLGTSFCIAPGHGPQTTSELCALGARTSGGMANNRRVIQAVVLKHRVRLWEKMKARIRKALRTSGSSTNPNMFSDFCGAGSLLPNLQQFCPEWNTRNALP